MAWVFQIFHLNGLSLGKVSLPTKVPKIGHLQVIMGLPAAINGDQRRITSPCRSATGPITSGNTFQIYIPASSRTRCYLKRCSCILGTSKSLPKSWKSLSGSPRQISRMAFITFAAMVSPQNQFANVVLSNVAPGWADKPSR